MSTLKVTEILLTLTSVIQKVESSVSRKCLNRNCLKSGCLVRHVTSIHHSKMAFLLAFSASSLFCRAGITWILILVKLSTLLLWRCACLLFVPFWFVCPTASSNGEASNLSPSAVHRLLLFFRRLFWLFPASAPDPFVILLTMKHP